MAPRKAASGLLAILLSACGYGTYPEPWRDAHGALPAVPSGRPFSVGGAASEPIPARPVFPAPGESPDLAVSKDLATPADLVQALDLAALPNDDMAPPPAAAPDLSALPDLAIPPDLSAHSDLAPSSDLSPSPNQCVDHACATLCQRTMVSCTQDSDCKAGSCNLFSHRCTTCPPTGNPHCVYRCLDIVGTPLCLMAYHP